MDRLTRHWGKNYVPTKLNNEILFEMSGEQVDELQAIIKKLAEYEDIGTVSEFKALTDKRTAEKPIRNDMCTCPTCGTHNEIIKRRRNTVNADVIFCWHCGQAIAVEQIAE